MATHRLHTKMRASGAFGAKTETALLSPSERKGKACPVGFGVPRLPPSLWVVPGLPLLFPQASRGPSPSLPGTPAPAQDQQVSPFFFRQGLSSLNPSHFRCCPHVSPVWKSGGNRPQPWSPKGMETMGIGGQRGTEVQPLGSYIHNPDWPSKATFKSRWGGGQYP